MSKNKKSISKNNEDLDQAIKAAAVEIASMVEETDRRFFDELNGGGLIGQAFRSICASGIEDVLWFEVSLLGLRKYPWERAEKQFPEGSLRRLDRHLRKLKKSAYGINEYESLLFQLQGTNHDWPQCGGARAIPRRILDMAQFLEQNLRSNPGIDIRQRATAFERIPPLMYRLKLETGIQHMAKMATIIGAAYEMRDFDENRLRNLLRLHPVSESNKRALEAQLGFERRLADSRAQNSTREL